MIPHRSGKPPSGKLLSLRGGPALADTPSPALRLLSWPQPNRHPPPALFSIFTQTPWDHVQASLPRKGHCCWVPAPAHLPGICMITRSHSGYLTKSSLALLYPDYTAMPTFKRWAPPCPTGTVALAGTLLHGLPGQAAYTVWLRHVFRIGQLWELGL